MHILRQVKISGLWHEKDISIVLHPDINFLIGKNGSGKTTVINLIAAALTTDIPTLDRIVFESVDLQLVNPEKKADRASVSIKKRTARDPLIPDLIYSVTVGDDKKVYEIGPMERRFATRDYSILRHSRTSEAVGDVLKRLSRVTWLSIHRAPTRPVREGRSYESSVEKKLEELGNALTRLLSELASRGESETRVFEQSLFRSLLPRSNQWQLFNSVKNLDLGAEREGLVEIFSMFNLEQPDLQDELDDHFRLVTSAIDKDSWSDPELLALGAMWSIHQVVQGWRILREKQAEIFRPRQDFLTVLNEMVHPKEMVISQRNELFMAMAGDRKLPLTELSSGEKQLVIILGEALLQRQSPAVYIADEPELSLHVTWQEKLTGNLRRVNPRAQVVFATHSPDIVGSFQDRIVDMEKLFA